MLTAPTIVEQDDPETQDTRFLPASVTGMISWREYQLGKKMPTSTQEIFNEQDD